MGTNTTNMQRDHHSSNSTMASPRSTYWKSRVRMSRRTKVMFELVKPHPISTSATEENRVWHWKLVEINGRDQ